MNVSICAQLLADNFTDDIKAGKNKNPKFFRLVDSEKLKNYPVGRWTQTKDTSDASLMTYSDIQLIIESKVIYFLLKLGPGFWTYVMTY